MTKTSYAKGGLALDQGQLLQQNSHDGIMVGIQSTPTSSCHEVIEFVARHCLCLSFVNFGNFLILYNSRQRREKPLWLYFVSWGAHCHSTTSAGVVKLLSRPSNRYLGTPYLELQSRGLQRLQTNNALLLHLNSRICPPSPTTPDRRLALAASKLKYGVA
jgi:hypothetical protein